MFWPEAKAHAAESARSEQRSVQRPLVWVTAEAFVGLIDSWLPAVTLVLPTVKVGNGLNDGALPLGQLAKNPPGLSASSAKSCAPARVTTAEGEMPTSYGALVGQKERKDGATHGKGLLPLARRMNALWRASTVRMLAATCGGQRERDRSELASR